MRWAGHATHIGKREILAKVQTGKPEGTKPLWRTRVG